jgi:hypothetical protein
MYYLTRLGVAIIQCIRYKSFRSFHGSTIHFKLVCLQQKSCVTYIIPQELIEAMEVAILVQACKVIARVPSTSRVVQVLWFLC